MSPALVDGALGSEPGAPGDSLDVHSGLLTLGRTLLVWASGFAFVNRCGGVGCRVDESSLFPSNSGCFGVKIAKTQGVRGRGARTLKAEITPTNLDVHL